MSARTEFMAVPAADLRPGDLIDLEGDVFADPARDRADLQFEFQRVERCDREAGDCVAVYIAGVDCFGFPPGHHVRRIAQGRGE